MTALPTDEIVFETRGGLGIITLNRPKALNALTLPMVEIMEPTLRAWAGNPAIQAVAILGAGEKGFCAGGDIRALHDSGKEGTPYALDFFAQEYRADLAVHDFPKPYIAFMDGITMGGGVGVSVHGAFRVVTDRTSFAMPETGIGLIPDVGGSYFLPRLPGRLGMFMALTGARLKAADCLYAGIGTHFMTAERIEAVLADLANADLARGAKGKVDEILKGHAEDPGTAPLASVRPEIDRLFAADSVEGVAGALRADGGDWAAKQLQILQGKSPTSLKLAFRQLAEGANLTMVQCLAMEYRLVSRIMGAHDFYEGVRAVIIDKDNAPQWQPSEIDGVDDRDIAAYFTDLGDAEWRAETA